ncbi:glutamyl-tRNA(Gln) amidotransferase subunit PET112 NDAI_0E04110 [Naumovozyma dairenensis CBS 421]|uniref:Glutamyl-tRNA(Gln) amidotransferase subunit B, mitochondrial n=1 Tax=Naumovozyma dairenensis (strain ATCC 10597 / BCRC 20456 / CBS 421 / NBRC 0211 / NRRL Y-12639) TaxID=1071378 RepID=G0WBV8_NAUDC|nr:hypothetical protein NDAI_0E04110 [Naumovozyma dairenensis CBS 421]CCD25228.1 hypothetical protein NDAI_0E04110 [Naumovozyma dairenensis CBS 421]
MTTHTMLLSKRFLQRRFTTNNKFKFIPGYKLKCGLEIHTQLNTKKKLFSSSINHHPSSSETPNSHTNFFDLSLPGTQPILNHESILFALKLSLALNSKINLNSQFDRKHYFYADQPQGYQITQHYSPFAKHGSLTLYHDIDNIKEPTKKINIIQLQIEQDTARSIYLQPPQNLTLLDFNRSNVPLIELVTEPEFNDIDQIKAFIRKYQNLIRHLHISTGDLEDGAMRIDVNVNVNEHPRVELKNLPNTTSIIKAIKYEYTQQVQTLLNQKNGDVFEGGTKSWDGQKTIKLRNKETMVDYRYMPDPELPTITLSTELIESIRKTMPMLPDDIINMLVSHPYCLTMKDAKILTINSNSNSTSNKSAENEVSIYNHEDLRGYYLETCNEFLQLSNTGQKVNEKSPLKLPTNWIIHELIGNLKKLSISFNEFNAKCMNPPTFAEFLTLIKQNVISNSSAKFLLFEILKQFKDSSSMMTKMEIDLPKLIKKYNLETIDESNEKGQEFINEICNSVIEQTSNDLITEIKMGGKNKEKKLKYLIGQSMKLSKGKISPKEIESCLNKILFL